MVEQSILKKFGIIKPSTNEKLLKTPKNLRIARSVINHYYIHRFINEICLEEELKGYSQKMLAELFLGL